MYKNVQCLPVLFLADDQVIIANSEQDINYMLRNLGKTSQVGHGNQYTKRPGTTPKKMKGKRVIQVGSIISKAGTVIKT